MKEKLSLKAVAIPLAESSTSQLHTSVSETPLNIVQSILCVCDSHIMGPVSWGQILNPTEATHNH